MQRRACSTASSWIHLHKFVYSISNDTKINKEGSSRKREPKNIEFVKIRKKTIYIVKFIFFDVYFTLAMLASDLKFTSLSIVNLLATLAICIPALYSLSLKDYLMILQKAIIINFYSLYYFNFFYSKLVATSSPISYTGCSPIWH